MRILFWTDGFWPRIGGIETQSIRFVEAMRERGHQYLVIAQKDCPDWPDEEIVGGATIVRMDFNGIVRNAQSAGFEKIREKIKYIIDSFNPDLIHLNTAIGSSAFLFLFITAGINISVVLTLHSVCTDNNAVCFVTGKILKAADAICCVSKSVVRLVQEYSPENYHKSRCIYNGLPLPSAQPALPVFNPPILLCLGRLSPEKGFHYAIASLARLAAENLPCRLVIAGDGPEREKLVMLVSRLKLDDRVSFSGAVDVSDVQAVINGADIVLTPSTEESFGLAALEAAQMQKPVIASDVGGLPEVVLHNETGLLVPAGNVTALAEAVKLLIQQPELAVKLGSNARARALESFTLASVTAEYDRVYTTCHLSEALSS